MRLLVWLNLVGRRIKKNPDRYLYTDQAMTPVVDEETETLELLTHSEAARDAVKHVHKIAHLTGDKSEPEGCRRRIGLVGKEQIGMSTASTKPKRRFQIILIKPSRYDDDGYVIQWMRGYLPSNSLAVVYSLARDSAQRAGARTGR